VRNALALLTILPSGRRRLPPISSAGLLAFPLVGALVGLLWCAAAAVGMAWWSPAAAASAVIVVDAVMTGGLHYDGVADVGDVVGSRRRGPAALEVARDPRVGALGVLALAVTLLLRVALLATLLVDEGVWTLFAVPVAGRAAMLHALHRCAPDPNSVTAPLAAGTTPRVPVLGLLMAIAALIVVGITPVRTAAAVAVVVGLVEGGSWCWRRRVGRASGDLVGALGVGGELAVLLVLTAG
jgi:adenosylcobinamide-GDP ribazoletransferase